VCDESDKVSLAQALFCVGSIVGTLSNQLGYVADRFASIPDIIVSNLNSVVAGLVIDISIQFSHVCLLLIPHGNEF
jgi:hypothetical protein